jgi:hypothetical protein
MAVRLTRKREFSGGHKMGSDETNKPGDVVERISQDLIFRKLLSERFDCSRCPAHKRRGSRLITQCLKHMEEFLAELTHTPKRPEK